MMPSRLLLLCGLVLLVSVACSVAAPADPSAGYTLCTHDVRNVVPPDGYAPEGARPAGVRLNALIANIKAATDVDYWAAGGGASIRAVEDGYVLVHADQAMQKRVAAFLDDLDRLHSEKRPAKK